MTNRIKKREKIRGYIKPGKGKKKIYFNLPKKSGYIKSDKGIDLTEGSSFGVEGWVKI